MDLHWVELYGDAQIRAEVFRQKKKQGNKGESEQVGHRQGQSSQRLGPWF